MKNLMRAAIASAAVAAAAAVNPLMVIGNGHWIG